MEFKKKKINEDFFNGLLKDLEKSYSEVEKKVREVIEKEENCPYLVGYFNGMYTALETLVETLEQKVIPELDRRGAKVESSVCEAIRREVMGLSSVYGSAYRKLHDDFYRENGNIQAVTTEETLNKQEEHNEDARAEDKKDL